MSVQDQWLGSLRHYLDNVRDAGVGAVREGARLEYFENLLLADTPPGSARGLLLPSEDHEPAPKSITLGDVSLATIPESQWPDRIAAQRDAKAGMKQYVWTTLNQGSVGSCGSEGKDGSLMLLREIGSQKRVLFNPYGTYNLVSGGSDRGSTLADNISVAQRYGCFPEDVWPRSRGWRSKPSDAAFDAAKSYRLREVVRLNNKDEFGTALLAGIPVYFGYTGHAIFAVELIDRERFWYKNSWGEGWGEQGFGTLAFRSVYWNYGVYGILAETWAGGDA